MTAFTESIVEDAALAWLAGAGWKVVPGGSSACARSRELVSTVLEQATLLSGDWAA